jgi:hypothetical protein
VVLRASVNPSSRLAVGNLITLGIIDCFFRVYTVSYSYEFVAFPAYTGAGDNSEKQRETARAAAVFPAVIVSEPQDLCGKDDIIG